MSGGRAGAARPGWTPLRAIAILGLALAVACGHAPTKPRDTRRTTPAPAKSKRPAKRAAVAPAVAPDAPVAVAPAEPAVSPAPGAEVQRGLAVWYGSGKMTASGERFDKRAMAAAHRTLRFGTRVRVTHERTGKAVVVRINDRGPFGDQRRIIDLTEAAAAQLGIIRAGVAPVIVEVLEAP